MGRGDRHVPDLSPAESRPHRDDREDRRARHAATLTALIYGGGQIVLGVLVYVALVLKPFGLNFRK